MGMSKRMSTRAVTAFNKMKSSIKMKPGFILLEAIIAMLIISMVSLTGLECVRMMNASVARFGAIYDSVQARRNALAVARHLPITGKMDGGTMAYGAYELRWRTQKLEAFVHRQMTLAGPAPAVTYRLYRVTLTTELRGRAIDEFEMLLTAKELPAEQ